MKSQNSTLKKKPQKGRLKRTKQTEKAQRINLILIFMLTTQTTFSQIAPSKCTAGVKIQNKVVTKASVGGVDDKIDINCPDDSNFLRIHAWVKVNNYDDGKKQVIMSIPNTLQVYLSGKYFRIDYKVDPEIAKLPKINISRWELIWIEIFDQTITLAIVNRWYLSDEPNIDKTTKSFLTSFSNPTGASKILKILDITDSGTEEAFIGIFGTFGYGCRPVLSLTYEPWALIATSSENSIVAHYVLDHQTQILGNLIDPRKEPGLINGGNIAVDSGKDVQTTVINSVTRSVFTQNKFMKINSIDMGYDPNEPVFGISVVFTAYFETFPTTSSKIVEIEGSKKIALIMQSDGKMGVEYNPQNQISSTFSIPLNTKITIKFYFGRFWTHTEGGDYIFDFEIIKETAVFSQRFGKTYMPQEDYALSDDGISDFWSVTFGSSSNSATDPYQMVIEMIAIYKGNVGARGPSDPKGYRPTLTDPYCKMQITHSDSDFCFKCVQNGNTDIKHFVDLSTKSLMCDVGTVPAGVITRTSPIDYLDNFLHAPCRYGERIESASCVACNPSCGGSCSGPNPGDCLSCNWAEYKYLSGTSPNTCQVCSVPENFGFGKCGTCSTTGGCDTCNHGKCQLCLDSESSTTFAPLRLGFCCKDLTEYITEVSGELVCQPCHSSCKYCIGPGREGWVTCKGVGTGIATDGLCADCPSNESNNDGTCAPCQAGCGKCESSSSICDLCLTDQSYYHGSTDLTKCILCTSPGYKINLAGTLPSCDICPSGSNCCGGSPNGLLNGYCKVCSDEGAYFLNVGDCSPCRAECTSCTSYDVCTGCVGGKVLQMNDLCGNCDTTNGYRVDTSSTPDRCVPCPTDCLVCSETGCTQCKSGKGYNSVSKFCENCSSNKYLTTGNSPEICQDCPAGCTSCTSNTACGSCDSSYYLDVTCHACPANCASCTNNAACDSCDPSYYLDGFCHFCDIENGNFIETTTPEKCTPCSSNCKVCNSAASCITCETSHVPVGDGSCSFCDIANGNFITLNEECQVCHSSCVKCLSQPGNCVDCQPNHVKLTEEEKTKFNVTQSNCIKTEEYEKLLAMEKETLQCHESCLSCFASNDPLKCGSCSNDHCLAATGECSTCPPESPVVTNPNNFFQTSTFNFVIRQRTLNNYKEYKLDFSEEDIFFDSNLDMKNISEFMTVQLSKSKNPEDYRYNFTFSSELNSILITLTFTSTIPSCDLTVEILYPEKIKSITGKKLSNKISKINFPGFTEISQRTKTTLNIMTMSTKGASTGLLATSSGTVAVSSLFSNAMSSLSKLIQIIEFSSMMQLYNIDYDQIMGDFLNSISDATEFDLLNSPTGKIVDGIQHSMAGIWKGKLSQVQPEPLLLQNLDYQGILMIGVYLIQAFFMLTFKKPGKKFTMFRIAIFNALIIDYSSICLRTLGYYPAALNGSPKIVDHLSYFLSCFIMFFFTYEFCFMYVQSNNPALYSPKEELKELNKSFHEVFYDGLKPEILKENWFARNYNLLFIIRFLIISFLIFNFQYLQIFQVIGSLIFMGGFAAMTFYHQIKYGIFSSKFVGVYRLIQEASMTLIMVLINTFMFDTFANFLSQNSKVGLIITFICLIALNIVLEIIGAFVLVVELLNEKCKKKKKEVFKASVAPKNAIDNVLNDAIPRKVNNGRKNGGYFSRGKNVLESRKMHLRNEDREEPQIIVKGEKIEEGVGKEKRVDFESGRRSMMEKILGKRPTERKIMSKSRKEKTLELGRKGLREEIQEKRQLNELKYSRNVDSKTQKLFQKNQKKNSLEEKDDSIEEIRI